MPTPVNIRVIRCFNLPLSLGLLLKRSFLGLGALSGRLPAMADRSWNPAAARTYADYQVRVASTTDLLSALLGLAPAGPPARKYTLNPHTYDVFMPELD